jgi:hypothetical protein
MMIKYGYEWVKVLTKKVDPAPLGCFKALAAELDRAKWARPKKFPESNSIAIEAGRREVGRFRAELRRR